MTYNQAKFKKFFIPGQLYALNWGSPYISDESGIRFFDVASVDHKDKAIVLTGDFHEYIKKNGSNPTLLLVDILDSYKESDLSDKYGGKNFYKPPSVFNPVLLFLFSDGTLKIELEYTRNKIKKFLKL